MRQGPTPSGIRELMEHRALRCGRPDDREVAGIAERSVSCVDKRPLPDSITGPASFVRHMDAATFLSDPRYNPSQRAFSPGEKFYIGSQVEIARGRIQVLEQEIISICARELDGLRSEGEFVLYGPDEPPRSVDAVTFGEQTEDGGMRLYVFYEEEYPEICARKEQQRRIAELLLRSLLYMAGTDS
jgi:hypothetical protein